MQTLLAIIAGVASLVGLLYAWLARRSTGSASGWARLRAAGGTSAAAFAAVLAVVLFVATLPTTKPFSPGTMLGWGFLIGSVLALYAVGEACGGLSSLPGLLSAASLGPSVILYFFHGDPTDAIAGFALGTVMVAVVFSAALRSMESSLAVGEARDGEWPGTAVYRGIETFAFAASAIAGGALLAMEHFPRSSPGAVAGGYWSLPGLLAAAGALVAILVSGAPASGRTTRWRALAIGLAAAIGMAALAGVLQWKLLPKLSWTTLLYGGIAIGGLCALLLHEERNIDAPDGAEEPPPVLAAFGGALLAVAVGGLAFRQLQGFGESLAFLAAATVACAVYGTRMSRTETLAESLACAGAAILGLLVWTRVFLEESGAGHPLDFQQYYSFIAITMGAGVGFAAMAFLNAAEKTSPARPALARTFAIGALVTAAPLVTAALWGERGIGALLAGLVAGEAVWMLLAAASPLGERVRVLRGAPHIFALAVAIIAARLAPAVLALEMTRAQKVILIAVLGVAALVWLLIDAMRRPRSFPEVVSDETSA